MILAVDVGNSNIVWSVWNGEKWYKPLRFDTDDIKEINEYEDQLIRWLGDMNIKISAVTSAIISSVVPAITVPLHQAISNQLNILPTILKFDIDTGISLAADYPERVGTDLIADAVGGYYLIHDRCIIVDLGTATTVLAVENPGVMSGVAISTGLKVSVEALVDKAAQLKNIPLKVPDSPLGRNTIEAMQSGLILGHLCMIEGLIERMKMKIGPAKVIATGGLINLLAAHTDHFDYVEPMLTLDGLRIIAERQSADNRGQ